MDVGREELGEKDVKVVIRYENTLLSQKRDGKKKERKSLSPL